MIKLDTRYEIICKKDYILFDLTHLIKDTKYYCWINESYDEYGNYEGLVYFIKHKNLQYAISLSEEDFNNHCQFIN